MPKIPNKKGLEKGYLAFYIIFVLGKFFFQKFIRCFSYAAFCVDVGGNARGYCAKVGHMDKFAALTPFHVKAQSESMTAFGGGIYIGFCDMGYFSEGVLAKPGKLLWIWRLQPIF